MVLSWLLILVASFSLLYLPHLQRPWSFLVRLRRTHDTDDTHTQNKDGTKILQQNKQKNEQILISETDKNPSKKADKIQSNSERETNMKRRLISDYEDMPPPSLPTKKGSSLSTENTSIKTTSSISAHNLNSTLINHDKRNQNKPASLAPIPSQDKEINNVTSYILEPSMPVLSTVQNRIFDPVASNAIKPTGPVKFTKKVMLKPGHSPLDWARLTASSINLSGLPFGTPYLKVPPSLLKRQTGRKGKDAWTVLGNKVYNITPYLSFHPGGEPELLRSAGRDGTKLFNEVHPWVNWEGMLASCFVGIAVEEYEVHAESEINNID